MIRRTRRVPALVAVLVALATGLVVPAGLSRADAATCGAATVSADLLTTTVKLGGSLRLRGAGWCHPDGTGSRIGVKIDDGAYSHVPGQTVHANATIWAIVDAADDGSFTVSIDLPDGTAATSTPALPTGSHTLRLLTGTLKDEDTGRTFETSPFTVVPADTPVPEEPDWTHVTLSSGSATAWVENDLPAGADRIRVAGAGWTRTAGGPSTIAVKLGRTSDGQQYERSGSAVVEGDPTIWAMIKPGSGSLPIAEDGSFSVTLDLPRGLTAGQYLTVSLFTGKFAEGDVRRTLTTQPLKIDGKAWSGGGGGDTTVCTPTSTRPTVSLVSTSVAFGGRLRITGTGWCNTVAGGARVAIKIDDGAYSRLNGSLHSNRTIWAIVDAKAADGTFSADIAMPDGTAATSIPALPRGSHTLRLLSGSLKAGDPVQSVESKPFVIGEYRPNGTPDPLAAKALKPSTRHGVKVTRKRNKVEVVVPGAAAGTWAFLSVYAADGSPRYPWNDRWFRLGAGGRLTVKLPAKDPVSGKLVVQSGELGSVGSLLGWARLPAGAKAATTTGTTTTTTTATTTAATSSAAQSVVARAPMALLAVPAPAVAGYAQLTGAQLAGTLTGTVQRVSVPGLAAGTPVFVYVYDATRALPAGWIRADDTGAVRVDLATLGPGEYRLGLQDAAGKPLGWTAATIAGEPETAPEAEAAPVARTAATPAEEESSLVTATDGWLIGMGATLLLGVALGSRRKGVLR